MDRAKARLTQFLRSLKEAQEKYIFCIRSAQGSWEIETLDELDNFFEELAGLSFAPLQNESFNSTLHGDIFIFSTACDLGLSSFLLACQTKQVFLFLIQNPLKKEIKKDDDEIETLYVSDFPEKGCVPSPKWFFQKNIKRLNVSASRIEIMYAETHL